MAETLRILRERIIEVPGLGEEPAGAQSMDDAGGREHPRRASRLARWLAPTREQPLPLPAPAGPGPCSPVFDNLLFLPDGRPVRTLVVAPAAPLAAAATAVRGILAEAERRALRTAAGRVEGAEDLLRIVLEARSDRRDLGAGAHPAAEPTGRLEISAREADAGIARLDGWLTDTVVELDLLVLAGPPLTASARAAAVATRCDGLLILAEAGTTTRKDLRLAVTAARTRGCHTFGVFVNEHPDKLTRWLSDL